MKRFISSLDKTSSIITWSIAALAVVILLVSIRAYKRSDGDPLILVFSGIAPVLLIGIMLGMYFFRIMAITLNDTSLTIERQIKPVNINYQDIKSVRKVQDEEMKMTIRTFGNGGLFGYTGLYYNKKLGSMNWYCTQRKNYILIVKTNNKQLVITPDDPDSFMRELRLIKPGLVME